MLNAGMFLLVTTDTEARKNLLFRTLDTYRTTAIAADVSAAIRLQQRSSSLTGILIEHRDAEPTAGRCAMLRELWPRVPVEELEMRPNHACIAGAATQKFLLDFVRAALIEECAIPDLAAPIITFARARRLTPREGELLAAVASGNSREQWMDELGISPNTCKRHARTLLAKLGETTLERAVIRMLRDLVQARSMSSKLTSRWQDN